MLDHKYFIFGYYSLLQAYPELQKDKDAVKTFSNRLENIIFFDIL